MFDVNLQYRHNGSQAATTVQIKSMPHNGDYIQYDSKAFFVERVYHIPKVINNVNNDGKADAILFGKFVSDNEISNFLSL